jgi:predicted membrane channel-forming protein YqfA (hemolysin III family)
MRPGGPVYDRFVDRFALPRYYLGDILANAITHGIGAGLAIAGPVCLIAASAHGSARLIAS